MNSPSEIILGIDPGTLVLGYGLIDVKGKKVQFLEMGVLKLSKYKDAYHRLQLIYDKVRELEQAFHPTAFAIEAPFFGKNVQSMLKLGRAQGVAIAAAMQAGMPVMEYSPKKIKQSITGNGNATKEQVWKMLQQILNIQEEPEFLDATDALAVALCHHYQGGASLAPDHKNYSGWGAFLQAQPHRIKS